MPTLYAPNIRIDGTEFGEKRGAIYITRVTDPAQQVRLAAQHFEQSIRTVLGEVRARDTGRAVLRAISAAPRRLLIVPYFGGSKDNPNACARPTHPQAARKRGYQRGDRPGLGRRGRPHAAGLRSLHAGDSDRRRDWLGTG